MPGQSQHKRTVSSFDDVSPDDAPSRVVANPAKADASPAQTGAVGSLSSIVCLRKIKSVKAERASSGLHEKQRLPVALRARCARVFESPHGTTCHAEGGEESPGFLRLPLSRARRVILHSSWLRLCRLESSAGPLFSGLIQWETCRQGRERLSLEA